MKFFNINKIIKKTVNDFILTEVRYINKQDYNQNPLYNNETIRVFHGCDNIETALIFAKYGFSGKTPFSRKYSYENGMNKNGLFVTIDFNVAKDNFALNKIIIEFSAHLYDLDTPVWNKQHTYYGANSNPEPFKNREERELQKKEYQTIASKSKDIYVSKSDNPALANMIFNNHEHQALFIGDLNPNMIKYFWVYINKKWIRMSRKKFLKIYKSQKISNDMLFLHSRPNMKLYKPNEDLISYDELVNRLLNFNKKRYPKIPQTKEKIENNLKLHLNKNKPNIYFITSILYPKQIIQLFGLNWFRKYINPLSSI